MVFINNYLLKPLDKYMRDTPLVLIMHNYEDANYKIMQK